MKKFDNYRKNLDVLRLSDQQDLNDDLKENCEAAEKLGIHTFQNVKFDDWLSLRF